MSKVFLSGFSFSLVLASFAMAQQPSYTSTLPDSIMAKDEPLNWLAKINNYCEGPVYDPATGMVYWTEQKSGEANWPIWRLDTKTAGAQAAVHIQNAYQANGLELDPQGRLVAVQNKRVTRYKANGSEDSVLVVSPASGNAAFNQSNDLSHKKDGSFYFTDLGSKIFFLSKTRQLKLVVPSGMKSANGIQVVEEENAVYVNENTGNQVTRFEIGPNDSLINPTVTFQTTSPDGSDMDEHGHWYFASYANGEVRFYDKSRQLKGLMTLTVATGYDKTSGKSGNVSNCAFGGPDNKTLYITGDGGLYSIKLKIAGRPRPNAATTGLGQAPANSRISTKQAKPGLVSGTAIFAKDVNKPARLDGRAFSETPGLLPEAK